MVLIVTLFTSLFHLWGAELTNNVLGVSLMILLISLFSDLKEFDFWGLKGKKEQKEIQDLIGKDAISEKHSPPPKQTEVKTAQQTDVIQLMDTGKGNFLTLAFEIERLLRIAATVVLNNNQPNSMNPVKLTKILQEKGLLTENGVKQVDSIRWVRNMLVHGRDAEINEATLNSGIELAYNFYMELKNWLDNPK